MSADEDWTITQLSSLIYKVEYKIPKESRFLCPKCNTEGSIAPGDSDFICPTGDYKSSWMPVMMHTIWTVWESVRQLDTDILERANSTPTIRK